MHQNEMKRQDKLNELLVAREEAQTEQQRWWIEQLIGAFETQAKEERLRDKAEAEQAMAEKEFGLDEMRARAYARNQGAAANKYNLSAQGQQLDNQEARMRQELIREHLGGKELTPAAEQFLGYDQMAGGGAGGSGETEKPWNSMNAGENRYNDAVADAGKLKRLLEEGRLGRGMNRVDRTPEHVNTFNQTAPDSNVMYIHDPGSDRYFRMNLPPTLTSNDIRKSALAQHGKVSPATINKVLETLNNSGVPLKEIK